MTKPKYDQDFWEQLWSKTLHEHADKVARRPPNAHLMAEAAQLAPGRALDAGCGHGADTLWLAAQGWQVTAVDFSAAALAHGRSMAEAAGADVAARIDWIESDLASWTAEPGHYDLVICLYVHVAGSVEDMVGRMANAVAPAGTGTPPDLSHCGHGQPRYTFQPAGRRAIRSMMAERPLWPAPSSSSRS